ncbi:unnamed protein product [Closterium sp. NIES-64]|nr:unnamed protein product [Closterium sp. NIES-64]
MAEASNGEAPPQQQTSQSVGDPFSAFSDNLLGAVLLRVACNGVRFVAQDRPITDEEEADAERKVDDALLEPLPSESAWLAGNPKASGEAMDGRSSGVNTLERLSLNDCQARLSLPHAIGHIPTLARVDLLFLDALTALPDSLGCTPQMRKLKVIHPRPPHSRWLRRVLFGQLGKLQELRLHACYGLLELLASFTNLSSLETLAIYGGTSLISLPPCLQHLLQLRRLELFNCAMPNLPERFGQLPKLEILKVGSRESYRRNGVDPEQPASPACPMGPSPATLNEPLLGRCLLHSFPASFSQLTCLQQMVIDGCDALDSLPEALGRLAALQVLHVKNCPHLRCFPSLLPASPPTSTSTSCAAAAAARPSPLPMLHSLEIAKCPRLISLPDGLHAGAHHTGRLHRPELTRRLALAHRTTHPPPLHHRHLPLKRLSPALFAPPSGAPPEDLLGDWEAGTDTHPIFGFRIDPHPGPPASLAFLSSLQHLAIALPQLARLPKNLGQLKALKELSVEFCDALMGLPASMGLLSSLVLSITECNKFSSLPASMGSLTRLASLKLNCLPRLRRLPESLSRLPALVILSLEDCEELQALPEGLAGVGRLREVMVAGCCKLSYAPQLLLARQNVIELQGLR